MSKKTFLGALIAAICFAVTTTFVGCTGGTGTGENQDSLKTDNTFDPKAGTLIKINDRLFSIPSPLQVSQLVKEAKLPYTPELLNPTTNVNNYSTNFKQSLNLGVYGANLGYLNIYDQLPDAAKYFAVVKMLGNELGITSIFDKETMQRIEENTNNKDSLIYIISTIYRDVDAYLLNNDRNEIGVLILAGGWIESLYFMAQSAKEHKSDYTVNRIGEQKHPLDNLIELLRPYYGRQSPEYDKLVEELIELASVFDGVVIEYAYEPPVVDEKKKLTTIKSKSKAIINDDQLQEITRIISAIRTNIIS